MKIDVSVEVRLQIWTWKYHGWQMYRCPVELCWQWVPQLQIRSEVICVNVTSVISQSDARQDNLQQQQKQQEDGQSHIYSSSLNHSPGNILLVEMPSFTFTFQECKCFVHFLVADNTVHGFHWTAANLIYHRVYSIMYNHTYTETTQLKPHSTPFIWQTETETETKYSPDHNNYNWNWNRNHSHQNIY